MGTRHLVCVVLGGEYRVAQYGQWDGYPSGQGEKIVKFMTSGDFDLATFKRKVSQCRALTAEEVETRWKKCGAKSEYVTTDVSEKMKKRYPALSRDTGADVLRVVYEAEKPEVFLNPDFAGDSLFCEWAYVLDLDREVLEVYRGFNKRPLEPGARFYGFETKCGDRHEDYYPVKLLTEISFKDLRGEGVMAGVQALADKVYEEEHGKG